MKWASQSPVAERMACLFELTQGLNLKAIFEHTPELLMGSLLEKDEKCLETLLEFYKDSVRRGRDAKHEMKEDIPMTLGSDSGEELQSTYWLHFLELHSSLTFWRFRVGFNEFEI